MKNIFKSILNLIFPPKLKCIFCGEDVACFDEKPYCPSCEKEDIFNNSEKRCLICDQPIAGESDFCENCRTESKGFNKATAPFIYTGGAKGVVLKLKEGAKYLAEPMARLMVKRLKENNIDFDVIIPVPLSQSSLKKRGFNQSELLAAEISRITQKPLRLDVLVKVKDTKMQKRLSFNERHKNLLHAFSVKSYKGLKGKNVLIVDDVITTCATTSAAANVLKNKVNKIFVVSFARTIKKPN